MIIVVFPNEPYYIISTFFAETLYPLSIQKWTLFFYPSWSVLAHQLIRGHGEENQGATANACTHACSVICDSLWTMDCSLPGSPVHGIYPGKNTRAGCHFLLQGSQPQGSNHISCVSCTGKQILYHYTTWGAHATASSQHQLPGLSMRFFWTPPSQLRC